MKLPGGSRQLLVSMPVLFLVSRISVPDQLSRPSLNPIALDLDSPLPQHHDELCRSAQNEGLWKQSAWLLAQVMLGFQWLKTRVQSAEAQQVAGAVDF